MRMGPRASTTILPDADGIQSDYRSRESKRREWRRFQGEFVLRMQANRQTYWKFIPSLRVGILRGGLPARQRNIRSRVQLYRYSGVQERNLDCSRPGLRR